MDRSDFIQRGEIKVDFLKYYRLVSRWACKQYDLNIADLELQNSRWWIYARNDWIKKIHNGNGRLGDHNKYTVSAKGKRLIARVYRILIDKESLPESSRRNRIMKRETYIDKVYSQAISKFNKKDL